MWGTVENKSEALQTAIELTGNHQRYGRLMNRVISEWPVSCENALTDYSINRKAWLGHAAVALGCRIPENIVREAWGHLSNEQRQLANAQAAAAIESWEFDYRKGREVHSNMGEQMLFGYS